MKRERKGGRRTALRRLPEGALRPCGGFLGRAVAGEGSAGGNAGAAGSRGAGPNSRNGIFAARAPANRNIAADRWNRDIAAGALAGRDARMRNAACVPSRGLRNRNPGNIRRSATRYRGEVYPSTDPAFKQFESHAWGYRAIFVLLRTYRVRYGLTTPAEMIARWAPPAENDTAGYIRAVCGQTGFAPDREIDTRDPTVMIRLAAAISRVENGEKADLREVRAGWALYERYPP